MTGISKKRFSGRQCHLVKSNRLSSWYDQLCNLSGHQQSEVHTFVEDLQAPMFHLLYHRGMTLWGKEIPEVFAEVDATYYFDSIWNDIENDCFARRPYPCTDV